jgi:hypothetical protein
MSYQKLLLLGCFLLALVLPACDMSDEDWEQLGKSIALDEMIRSSATAEFQFNTTKGPGYITSRSSSDSDRDGLSDVLEWQIAAQYAPYLVFSKAETNCLNPKKSSDFDIYYQVSPLVAREIGGCNKDGATTFEEGYIYLTYLLAYDRDCGAEWKGADFPDFIGHSHNGDAEKTQLVLECMYDACTGKFYTRPDEVLIKRHFDDEEPYEWSDMNKQSINGGPVLYVSGWKHATYVSYAECTDYSVVGLHFELCGGGIKGWARDITGFLDTEHNVGEKHNPVLLETHQWNGFPVWDKSKGKFCGSHKSDCGGAPFVEKWVVRDARRPKVGLTDCKVPEESSGDPDGSLFKVTCTPQLISPAQGALLDNGRKDGKDQRIWKFTWSACQDASEYQLYVKHPSSENPVINQSGIRDTNYIDRDNDYVFDQRLTGWTWKVRAKANGEWGPWSTEQTFDVEPVNTDPPE